MKIGQAIQEINRSETERLRIMDSVLEGTGKPSEMYSAYSTRIQNTAFWKKAQKKLKITGFRPNKAHNLILTRILKGIADNNKICTSLFWELYGHSVVEFIQKEHSNLNQLLLDKEMEGDADSTDEIVKVIMRFIELYEVGTEQIEELYEVWWFERTGNLYDIFSTQELSLEIVKGIVLRSERVQGREIDKLNTNISKLESIIEENATTDQYGKELENINEKYESLKEEFYDESEKIEQRVSRVIDGKIFAIENRKENDDTVGTSLIVLHDLEDKVTKNENKIEKLSNLVETLVLKKEKKEKERVRGREIFSNTDVIRNSLSKIIDDYNISSSNTAFLMSILNSFSSFYIESDVLFRALSENLISEGKVKEVVASPAMIELSSENIGELEEYDIIYIKNVISCFVEGSVIPILLKANSLIDKNFPKVFILHDDEINSSVSAKIKSHTMSINYEWLSEINKISTSDSKKMAALANVEEVALRHREMLMVLENSGVKIDQQIFERFVRLSNLLSSSGEERKSLSLSAQGVLYPYIRSSYGDSKALVIIEIMDGIL